MKLLYCIRCKEIITLTHQLKSCSCGITRGMFNDTNQAQYTGEFAIPLEADNEALEEAIRNQPAKELNEDASFDVVVLPKVYRSLERIS